MMTLLLQTTNITTFQDGCRSAMSWRMHCYIDKVAGGGGGGEEKFFGAPIYKKNYGKLASV